MENMHRRREGSNAFVMQAQHLKHEGQLQELPHIGPLD